MRTAMIVDDSAFMRRMIRERLESLDVSIVCEAATGWDAINYYPSYKPQIVTMDITLPDINGIEATKHITSIDSNVSIVVVSAMGQQSMVIESLQAGAKDFVVKPFSFESIKTAIEKVIHQYREV